MVLIIAIGRSRGYFGQIKRLTQTCSHRKEPLVGDAQAMGEYAHKISSAGSMQQKSTAAIVSVAEKIMFVGNIFASAVAR